MAETGNRNYLKMIRVNVNILLSLGLLACIVVGIGEYLLHFLPGGPEGEISMLEDVPLERASIGHFLVVFGAPLYIAGYFGLRKLFEPTSLVLSRFLLIGGVLSFTIGGVWVSSRYFAAEVLQRSAGTADFEFYLQSYEDHYQILVWALRFLIAYVSVCYIWLIMINKQGLPKWLAIFNPIFILIVVFSTLFWIKPLGVHIAPIAMNVTHFIFFGAIMYFANRLKAIPKYYI